ncbi:MAG: AgmX/PglI C-terminal domain-containing protein [Proteobacteria bacterium]|jgi:hypothetical protein|nr:AgmX/PglI C-terminal domain-containing protein [Pseudomonadota bacterium]
MQNLLIEQRSPEGLLKTWRLREEQGPLTFGHSRHAALRSPANSIRGIQGVFEFRNGHWYYINLDQQSNHPEFHGKSEIRLDQPLEIKIGTNTLTLTPYDARSPLFKTLEKTEISQPSSDRKPYQLYTVYQGPQLLETTVVSIGETFSTKFDPMKTAFVPTKTEQWKKTQLGNLEISERTVYLTSAEAMSSLRGQKMDREGKMALLATLAGAFALALLFTVAPEREVVDVVEVELPPIMREAKIEPPKKQKKAGDPVPQQMPQPPTQQQAQAQDGGGPKAPSGSSKAASAIKSLSSGRISQLVGKVSAGAAKSNNVIISQGITAGQGPSGRALAAVGSLNKSGTDWSSEGKGNGVAVATAGKAGGQGTGQMGQLAGGKAGQGGVGLLEEEGEIVGGLDREVIAAYIRSQLGQILYCYERQLSAQPDLYGKVAIKFTISGDGSIETQRIADTTLKNSTVEGCILSRVAKWKFPTPDGGTKVMVTYPFLFKSTN